MFQSGDLGLSVGKINSNDENREVINRKEDKGSKPALENLVEAKGWMAVVRRGPPRWILAIQ